jgi:hypothetical protein
VCVIDNVSVVKIPNCIFGILLREQFAPFGYINEEISLKNKIKEVLQI